MGSSLLLAVLLGAASSSAAVEPLRLELLRPAGSDPVLGVRVLRVFPKGEVPCAGARVVLTLPGGLTREERAEASGVARFDSRQLSYVLPEKGGASLAARGRCGALSAEASFGVSAAELKAYLQGASKRLADEGVRLAGSARMPEARALFEEALALDPGSSRARYNLALADEKLGRRRLAVAEYVRYLLMHPEAPDRAALGRKVARLARGLKPGPPLPAEAAEVFEKGRLEAASGRWVQAGAAFAAAQALAPWWPEPYRAAGLLREQQAMRGKGAFLAHSEAALAEYRSFLETAPGDPRAADVKSRMERLRAVRSGLNAPQRIRIQ